MNSNFPIFLSSRDQCVEDWLEIYQMYRDNSEELVGRYCANSATGPVVSLREISVGLKVFFHTDSKDVYSGFLGEYIFFEEKSVFGDGECSFKGRLFIGFSDLYYYAVVMRWAKSSYVAEVP